MKSLILILTLCLVFTGCSSDNEDSAIEIIPIQKVNGITVSTGGESPLAANLTGKNVQRGIIFGSIKDITVTANANNTGYSSQTVFNLTSDPGDPTVFNIDNVQIGYNTFTATTTTGATAYNQVLSTFGVLNSDPIETQQTKAKAEIARMESQAPWAEYNGASESIYIRPNVSDNVIIPLSTDNGRVIIYFSCNALKKNSKDAVVTITPFIDGVSGSSVSSSQTADITFQWSSSDCLAGKKIYFRCSVAFSGKNVYVQNTTEITIKKSTSSRRLYSIDQSGSGNNLIAIITELPTK